MPINRLRKAQDDKAQHLTRCKAILELADGEGRELTADESKEYEAEEALLQKAQGVIEREEKLAAIERSMVGQAQPPGEHGPVVGNVKPAWIEDPKRGFKSHAEFLTACMAAVQRGQVSDERLQYLSGSRTRFLATAGSDEAGSYSDAYGGFLVPVGFSPNFLATPAEPDPMGLRVTRVPMNAPVVNFNARVDKDHSTSVSGGLTVKRRMETQTQAASRIAFHQVTLRADSLYGLAYATEELLSDSPQSFTAMIDAGFNDQFNWHLVGERLEGTGVGEYTGINKCGALISVDEEAGQDADSIVYENVVKMRARCWRYDKATWHYNHDCLPTLMAMVIPIGTGGIPAWSTSARDGEPDMFLGRPAFPTEHCETVGDAGDIVLTVWSEYLEGIYRPVEMAESIHVRFLENERTFRFTMRCGGAPWWKSVLTPKKSATTLSPFVRLAARA